MNMERLRTQLAYSPETGGFTWLVDKKGSAARVGEPAGCKRSDGYLQIVVDGRRCFSHRLAWLMAAGPIPDGMEIDHINHDRSDNRLSNLRLATRGENRSNRSPDSRNKSGVNGVHWAKHANAWVAQIRHQRKTRHLGYFKSLGQATAARVAEEQRLGFHSNHGRKAA